MSTRRGEKVSPTQAVAVFETGWGEGAVVVEGGRLVGVDLPAPGQAARVQGAGEAPSLDVAAAKRWAEELEAYFRGERLSWTAEEVGLDYLEAGSFARDVFEALLTIPAGSTVSYGALAALAGYPRAARAAGSVMAGNPVPIVVPCHRVIHSDGRLGRYGSDDSWKPRLLAHERKHVSADGDDKGTG